MARPSSYTEEIGRTICDRIAAGASLRDVARCRDMPPLRTICDWIVNRDDFYSIYVRARQAQAHVIADEILELIKDLTENIPAGQNAMPAVVARSKQIDGLRWYLSRLLPRDFGGKPMPPSATGAHVTIYLPARRGHLPGNGDYYLSQERPGDGARVIDGTAHELEDDGD